MIFGTWFHYMELLENGAKSLQRIFQIIDLLKAHRELRLQEIADALGLCKSTAHRLTFQLCRSGYLSKNSETKTYQLGMKFLDISSHIIDNLDIRELAKPGIRRLNELTQETIHLALLMDRQVIYVDKQESPRAIRMYSQIGKVAPLYCTGVGKAVLAFQAPEKIDELLESVELQRFTANTLTDRESLLRELASIRRNGFAMDREEHELHVGCIAAPVRDYTQEVIGSISITAVLHQMKTEALVKHKDLLMDVCMEISQGLGFRGGAKNGAGGMTAQRPAARHPRHRKVPQKISSVRRKKR